MNRIIRNLLPQDTRAVEFPSAFSLLLLGVFFAYDIIDHTMLLSLHPVNFWAAITTIIGSLQLYALIQFPRLDVLRAVCNWVSGTFFIWISFNDHLTIGSIVIFFLGFFNLLAFLINTAVLSETWKQ